MNLSNSLLAPLLINAHQNACEHPAPAGAGIIVLAGTVAALTGRALVGLGTMHAVAFAVAAFALTAIASIALIHLGKKLDGADVKAQACKLIPSGHEIQKGLKRAHYEKIISYLSKCTPLERKLMVDQVLNLIGHNSKNGEITYSIFDHLIKFNAAERNVIIEQSNRIKEILGVSRVLSNSQASAVGTIVPIFKGNTTKVWVDQAIELIEKNGQQATFSVSLIFEDLAPLRNQTDIIKIVAQEMETPARKGLGLPILISMAAEKHGIRA